MDIATKISLHYHNMNFVSYETYFSTHFAFLFEILTNRHEMTETRHKMTENNQKCA